MIFQLIQKKTPICAESKPKRPKWLLFEPKRNGNKRIASTKFPLYEVKLTAKS